MVVVSARVLRRTSACFRWEVARREVGFSLVARVIRCMLNGGGRVVLERRVAAREILVRGVVHSGEGEIIVRRNRH